METIYTKEVKCENGTYTFSLVRDGFFIFERRQPYYLNEPDSMRHSLWGVVTPELWKPDPISGVVFVYGSNKQGINSKGAAETARQHYRAEDGVGVGFTGGSYAIPTKIGPYCKATWAYVGVHVEKFIQEAFDNPHISFLVTRLGCGLAGFKDSEIAPLFAQAPGNCILPTVWMDYLPILAMNMRLWHNREPGAKFMSTDCSYRVTGGFYSQPQWPERHFTEETLKEQIAKWQE